MFSKRLHILILISASLCFLGKQQSCAQKIPVSVFSEQNIQTFVITSFRGCYNIEGDHSPILTLKPNNVLYLTLSKNRLVLRDANSTLGRFKLVEFTGTGEDDCIKLKPVFPTLEARIYDDNMMFKVGYRRIQAINKVELENYVAGAVEAESGIHAESEFYKCQAILCRTYALSHLDRHSEEGFSLCDGVHCQAYKGRSVAVHGIVEAVKATKGLVVSEGDSCLAVTTFHSNCGGETEKAEDVWLVNRPYLMPVIDPYCIHQPNALWEVTIPVNKWKEYLQANGFDLSNFKKRSLEFQQPYRKTYYKIDNDSLSLRKIREDWKFKSSFFTIVINKDKLVFKGRGYGHGVGLCQEGAMQMAKLGYNYKDIINFYFKGIQITAYNEIPQPNRSLAKAFSLKNK